jgi:hypothetical protein
VPRLVPKRHRELCNKLPGTFRDAFKLTHSETSYRYAGIAARLLLWMAGTLPVINYEILQIIQRFARRTQLVDVGKFS